MCRNCNLKIPWWFLGQNKLISEKANKQLHLRVKHKIDQIEWTESWIMYGHD